MAVQWTTVGDVDIDIGANPSAEEAEEGVESTDRKTVDIIESFRLNVSYSVSQLPAAIFVQCCDKEHGLFVVIETIFLQGRSRACCSVTEEENGGP